MTAAVVALRPGARRAAGLALHYLPIGTVVELTDGRRLRVMPGGELDPVVMGGRPHGGIGEDPSAEPRA